MTENKIQLVLMCQLLVIKWLFSFFSVHRNIRLKCINKKFFQAKFFSAEAISL